MSFYSLMYQYRMAESQLSFHMLLYLKTTNRQSENGPCFDQLIKQEAQELNIQDSYCFRKKNSPEEAING